MEGEATVERLEAKKREALVWAIDNILPEFANADKVTSRASARVFAAATLDDIRQGNNPDLEPSLRRKVEELGIEL